MAHHWAMRLHRMHPLFIAAIVLGSCGGDPAAVTPATETSSAATTDPPTTVAATTTTTTTAASTTTTVPFVDDGSSWLLVRVVDDRDVEAPIFTFHRVAMSGAVTDLWSEDDGRWTVPLDVDAGRDTVLLRRLEDRQGRGDMLLVERDLTSGAEHVIASSPIWFRAEYVDDGDGSVLMTETAQVVDEHGIVSSTEGLLRVLAADGTVTADLQRRPIDATGDIVWVQAEHEGAAVVVLAGRPMTVVTLDGVQIGELGDAQDQWCTPVRVLDDGVLARCKVEATSYFHQLWTFPMDGAAPTQITTIPPPPDVPDFGSWDLWTMPNGTIYVQRFADCGGIWIEQLQPDGTTTEVPFGGRIIGRVGDRLVVVLSGGCEHFGARIELVDPATGSTTPLIASPFPDDPDVRGIDSDGYVWVDTTD
jgi:hypothetical protein